MKNWKNHTHKIIGPYGEDYLGGVIGEDEAIHFHVTIIGPTSPAIYNEDGSHYHQTAMGPSTIGHTLGAALLG
jgi:hypothetical protein